MYKFLKKNIKYKRFIGFWFGYYIDYKYQLGLARYCRTKAECITKSKKEVDYLNSREGQKSYGIK